MGEETARAIERQQFKGEGQAVEKGIRDEQTECAVWQTTKYQN